MLLISYILGLNDEWRDAKVRVIKVVPTKERQKIAEQNIKEKLFDARLNAEARVIVNEGMKTPVKEIMWEESHDTSLVVMGLPVPRQGEEQKVAEAINEMVKTLPTTLLVRSVFTRGVFE